MNELIYRFRDSNVRVIMDGDTAWFLAKDVCDILDIVNVTQAIQRLDEDERSMFKIGRQGNANFVNEFGLYTLVLNSRKPEAREFKRWITHEVIPIIRKTGSYTQNKQMSHLEIMQIQIEQMIKQEKALEELKTKQIALETKVDDFKDIVSTNTDNWRTETSILIKRIANNMGGTHLIREVHNRVYEDLEARGKCNLDIRLSNFKKRCDALGVPSSKVKAKNNLDVIAEDAKLVEIYVTIVKEYAVKGRI